MTVVLVVAGLAAYGTLCFTTGCLIGHLAARRYHRERREGTLQ